MDHDQSDHDNNCRHHDQSVDQKVQFLDNLQALMTRGEPELTTPGAKFLVLGLGLLFLGRQEDVDATLEVHFHFLIVLIAVFRILQWILNEEATI